MSLFLGTALGLLVSFLLAVPAIILEASQRVQNAPLIMDVRIWRDKKLTHGEAFAFGLLIHLIIGACYGFFYTLFAAQDWLFITNAPYTLHSMIIFAVCAWVALGFVLPIFGFGLFGRKEGNTVWFELLSALLLEGAILWILIQFYKPFFF